MLRPPIFILLLLFSILSCQKDTKTVSASAKNNKSKRSIQAQKYSELGDSFNRENKNDSAFYYYNKSKELFEAEGDSPYIAYNLLGMAHIQQAYGDYYSSEETLTEALPYINNDLQYQMAANNLFGIAAKEVKNYDDAVRYYTTILKATNDSVYKATAFNNIATVYIKEKEYRKAIALLKPILKSNILDTLPNRRARIIDNLGFSYYKDNQIPEGLSLMNEGLEIRTKINDSYGSIESYLHLADFYKNRDYQKSKENALQAYKVATKHQSIDERLEALEFLMSYNPEKGMNSYATLFINLNDSIKTVRSKAKNQFAKIKYDSRKTTLENIKYKGQRTKGRNLTPTRNTKKPEVSLSVWIPSFTWNYRLFD
jgi:tetratricopeptide (TPR) repeat protein